LQSAPCHKSLNELGILSLIGEVRPEVLPRLVGDAAAPAHGPRLHELVDNVLVTFVLAFNFALSEASILIDLVQLREVLRLLCL